MLTADVEFREIANAAAAAFHHAPPYVAYRASVNVVVPALKRDQTIERAVEARTSDDTAVLQDLPHGMRQLGQSFPVLPTFDALSYFSLDFHLGDPLRQHNPLSGVKMYKPIEFAPPSASNPDTAVVVTTLRNYYAQYAQDSNDRLVHLVMNPLPALTRNNPSDFYIHDVYADATTLLPTRVTYRGAVTDFDVDYTVASGHWVIDHAFYRHTILGPLHIGRTTFTVESRYLDYTFPDEPAAPELRPKS